MSRYSTTVRNIRTAEQVARRPSRLARLQALGFDNSKVVPFTSHWRVSCSQCEAVVINGTPTHETGCPNAVHECDGCNALVPVNVRYCEDCR